LEKDALARQMTGERIVIMMDANGDVMRGQLKSMEMNLGLKNTILTHNKSREPPATHKRGSQMINVILSSPEIVITGAAMLGGKDSLGDHHTFVVDFEEDSLIGENLLKIVHLEARRLVCGQLDVRCHYSAHHILPSPQSAGQTSLNTIGAIRQPTTLPRLVRENGPTRQDQNGTNAGSRKEVPKTQDGGSRFLPSNGSSWQPSETPRLG
jgi:hypothetical protein